MPSFRRTESSRITTAHGSSAMIVVGPPSGLATRNVPSSDRTRSASPLRPPPGSRRAPPLPSSVISTRNLLSSRLTLTRAWRASLCFAMFVSDSATMKYAADSTFVGGRSSRLTCTVTGTGHRAASDESAASRPRSVSTAGWMPRTSSRSSAIACLVSSCARSMSAEHFGVVTVRSLLTGEAEVHGGDDQTRLHAVVEVALDAGALGLGDVERRGLADLELRDPPVAAARCDRRREARG